MFVILTLMGNSHYHDNSNKAPITDNLLYGVFALDWTGVAISIQVFNIHCSSLIDDLSGAPVFNKALIRSPVRFSEAAG